MSVTSGRKHFEDLHARLSDQDQQDENRVAAYTIVNAEERNIKGSSSKIVDNDLRFTALFVQAVRNSGGGGLVDDTQNIQTSDGTGILGSLTLGVVKV